MRKVSNLEKQSWLFGAHLAVMGKLTSTLSILDIESNEEFCSFVQSVLTSLAWDEKMTKLRKTAMIMHNHVSLQLGHYKQVKIKLCI